MPVRFAACGIVAVLSLVVLAALATIVRRRDRSLVTPSAGITVMRDEKAPASNKKREMRGPFFLFTHF